MSQGRHVPYSLVRFKNFSLQILRNRMAFVGLVILFLFVTLALAAPVLTPYQPQGDIVSGKLAGPDWVPMITGATSWSRNQIFSGLQLQPSPGVQTTISTQTVDSANFTVNTGPAGGKILLVESLAYAYHGPPEDFKGTLSVTPYLPSGQAAVATAYLQRLGNAAEQWTLWESHQIAGSTPNSPAAPFSSATQLLLSQIGQSGYTPSTLIFSQKTGYNYVLEIDLPPNVSAATIYVQRFSLLLYGTVWGLLGTDSVGNDIFTQFAYGSRVSLTVGLVATFIGVGVGLVVGLIAGYVGRIVDEVLMRFTDMMLVLPGLPLLIVLVAVLGPSLLNIILVLGFLGWMGFARVIRSQFLSLRARPFIEAAKASGAGTGYILVRHVFPNIVSLTYVSLALSVPAAIVGEAALSFLGLGDPTTITWGQMLQRADQAGINTANLAWWWIIPPGVAIALISLSFILLGYAMDEMFNPRLRRRR